jgi:hypothetical protein
MQTIRPVGALLGQARSIMDGKKLQEGFPTLPSVHVCDLQFKTVDSCALPHPAHFRSLISTAGVSEHSWIACAFSPSLRQSWTKSPVQTDEYLIAADSKLLLIWHP